MSRPETRMPHAFVMMLVIITTVVEILEGLGYRVAADAPYAGGKIVREMGEPAG